MLITKYVERLLVLMSILPCLSLSPYDHLFSLSSVMEDSGPEDHCGYEQSPQATYMLTATLRTVTHLLRKERMEEGRKEREKRKGREGIKT